MPTISGHMPEFVQHLGDITDEGHSMFFLKGVGICVYIEEEHILMLYRFDGSGGLEGQEKTKQGGGCVRCRRGYVNTSGEGWVSVVVMDRGLDSTASVPEGIRRELTRVMYESFETDPSEMADWLWDSKRNYLCGDCHESILDGIEGWVQENSDSVVSRFV